MNIADILSRSHAAAIASGAAYPVDPECAIEIDGTYVHVHAVLPLVSDRPLCREELALIMTLTPMEPNLLMYES